MITITYVRTNKDILSTESVPDVVKGDVYSAYMDKAPWRVCNASYQILGFLANPASAASQTLVVTCKFRTYEV